MVPGDEPPRRRSVQGRPARSRLLTVLGEQERRQLEKERATPMSQEETLRAVRRGSPGSQSPNNRNPFGSDSTSRDLQQSLLPADQSAHAHPILSGPIYESSDPPPMSALPSARIPDNASEEAPLPQGWETTILPDGSAVYVNHVQKAFSKVRPSSAESSQGADDGDCAKRRAQEAVVAAYLDTEGHAVQSREVCVGRLEEALEKLEEANLLREKCELDIAEVKAALHKEVKLKEGLDLELAEALEENEEKQKQLQESAQLHAENAAELETIRMFLGDAQVLKHQHMELAAAHTLVSQDLEATKEERERLSLALEVKEREITDLTAKLGDTLQQFQQALHLSRDVLTPRACTP
jgi:hypothetical protein